MNLTTRDLSVGLSITLTKETTPDTALKIFQSRSSQIQELKIWNVSEENQKIVTDQIGSLTWLIKCELKHSKKQTYTFPKKFFTQLSQQKHLKVLEIVGHSFEEWFQLESANN